MIRSVINKLIKFFKSAFFTAPEIKPPTEKIPGLPEIDERIIFKYPQDKIGLAQVSPQLIELMNEMCDWSVIQRLPFVITDTVSTLAEDKLLGRVSPSHREGRAFDISVRGWGAEYIEHFVDHFNTKYKNIAAISADSGLPKLVIYHNSGHGDHFHVQLNRAFKSIG